MLSCKTVEEFFGSAEDPYSVRESRLKRSENSTDITIFLMFIYKYTSI